MKFPDGFPTQMGPWLQYLGAGLFFASLAAGLVGALVEHRSLPSLDLDYKPHIDEILERDGPAAAIPHLVTATKIDYANARAVTHLFNIARDNRDLDATVFAVQEIVRRKHDNAQYRRIFVEALLRQRRYAEAYRHGQVALHLDSQSPIAHCLVGRALVALGRNNEAVKHYRAALKLDPNSREAKSVLGYPLHKDF